ncbi:MAG: DNA cytosine methyltransferase, partial [Calditrichota bacterium]
GIAVGLIIDNFAGGGGASVGIEMALGRPVDIAINHDADAIRMHIANHPQTLHLQEDVFAVNPRKVCAGRDVDVAWFSPDCTHFSRAKGSSLVRNRKIRGLAWVVVKWAHQVRPRLICLENVEEFMTWGPLIDGCPDPNRKGESFRRFTNSLSKLGYNIEWRSLTAADYGAPTSRKRFFLIARCDEEPIIWPRPTHGPLGTSPYKTAAESIDWSIPTLSIFATKEEAKAVHAVRPLAENTLHRIARGIVKFIINAENPYVLSDEQTAAFLGYHFTGHDGYDVRHPLKTITARDHHTLVTTLLAKYHGIKSNESRCHCPSEPIPTQDTSNRFGLVSANLVAIAHTQTNSPYFRPADQPVGTITTGNKYALCTSFLTKMKGTNDGQDPRDPLQTITAGGFHFGLVTAFLQKYYGNGEGQSLHEPTHTITSKGKFALVTIRGEQYGIADIGLRMLQPRELATAQGFPQDYVLTGTKASQVKRIGNSVPPQVVAAIVHSNVSWETPKAEMAAA